MLDRDEGDAILAGLATDPEDVEAMEEAARRRARLVRVLAGVRDCV